MRAVGVWVLVLAASMPLEGAAEQADPTRMPLVIRDKAAVEAWNEAKGDGSEPRVRSDTTDLLALSETELAGRFWYRQRCSLCHVPQVLGNVPKPLGPVLTRRNIIGREDAARRRIMEGSARMPAYKYGLEPGMIDAILTYLKTVDPAIYGDAQ